MDARYAIWTGYSPLPTPQGGIPTTPAPSSPPSSRDGRSLYRQGGMPREQHPLPLLEARARLLPTLAITTARLLIPSIVGTHFG